MTKSFPEEPHVWKSKDIMCSQHMSDFMEAAAPVYTLDMLMILLIDPM